ncbi:hypothetical protein PTKIN_Ptkin12aG0000100 [Pterospermum kingtungense]
MSETSDYGITPYDLLALLFSIGWNACMNGNRRKLNLLELVFLLMFVSNGILLLYLFLNVTVMLHSFGIG